MSKMEDKNAELQQVQLDLFKQFYLNGNDDKHLYSNLIGLWDVMPRYSISKLMMNKLRDDRGTLRPHFMDFQYRNETYSLEIQPAFIKNRLKPKVKKEPSSKETIALSSEPKSDESALDLISFYPSANEELVEYALRKIFIEKNGAHDTHLIVNFTIYELCEMLKRLGHARSNTEVIQSLEILSRSKIVVSKKAVNGRGKIYIVSSYLNDMRGVDYAQSDDETPVIWSARFHPLVADAIQIENYRQFNLQTLMNHKTQLARWLHQLLIDKYVFASKLKLFEMRYSTIARDSQMLNNYSRERAAIEATISAFEELKLAKVISGFTVENECGERGKIIDVVFKITPSVDFIYEVKTANKRKDFTKTRMDNVRKFTGVDKNGRKLTSS